MKPPGFLPWKWDYPSKVVIKPCINCWDLAPMNIPFLCQTFLGDFWGRSRGIPPPRQFILVLPPPTKNEDAGMQTLFVLGYTHQNNKFRWKYTDWRSNWGPLSFQTYLFYPARTTILDDHERLAKCRPSCFILWELVWWANKQCLVVSVMLLENS
jgi:hypothetical protein